MAEDFWGDLPTGQGLRTPHSILAEQAQLLEKKTSGLLIGRLSRVQTGIAGQLSTRLQIYAPSLKYTYRVLDITHGVTLYPTTVNVQGPTPNIVAKTEEELKAALRTALSSEQVRRVVAGLLAQIRAESGEVASDDAEEAQQ